MNLTTRILIFSMLGTLSLLTASVARISIILTSFGLLRLFLHFRLSLLGESQVKELPASVLPFLDTVELVVVSPLTRAINTCLGAFDPLKVCSIHELWSCMIPF